MNSRGKGRRGCIEIDVKRLHEGFVDGATLRSDFTPPILDDHLLNFRRAWIVDPSMAFAGDPIERLAAMPGHEQRDFMGCRLGDEVSPQQLAAAPANGRK
ncbi:hypothetical protein D3C78_1371210 [compost metagenome]